jgi:hypothetical protein
VFGAQCRENKNGGTIVAYEMITARDYLNILTQFITLVGQNRIAGFRKMWQQPILQTHASFLAVLF